MRFFYKQKKTNTGGKEENDEKVKEEHKEFILYVKEKSKEKKNDCEGKFIHTQYQ